MQKKSGFQFDELSHDAILNAAAEIFPAFAKHVDYKIFLTARDQEEDGMLFYAEEFAAFVGHVHGALRRQYRQGHAEE